MNILRTAARTILLVSLAAGTAGAQAPAFRSVVISAGTAVPYSDEQFYDYWRYGYGVRAEFHDASTEALSMSAAADVLWFGLHSERLFQRFMVTAESPGYSGGWKTVTTVEGVLRYRIPGYTVVLPSVFAGAGIQHMYRAEMVIDYPFAPATTPGVSLLSVVVPFGASVRFPYKDKFDLQVDLHHVYPVTGSSRHGYSGIRIGVVLPMDRTGEDGR